MSEHIGGEIEAIIARARAASEKAGLIDDNGSYEREQRLVALRDTVVRLPNGVARAKMADIQARVDRRIWAALVSWRWDQGNVLLLGPTRRGKSTAAAWTVRRLCAEAVVHGGEAFEMAKSIHFQECRELALAAKEWKLGHGEPEQVTRCKNARLLILDDWGPTDDRDTLERIMQIRYRSPAVDLPTIFTSGMTRDQLKKQLGDALCSRLVECGARKSVVVEAFGDRQRNP